MEAVKKHRIKVLESGEQFVCAEDEVILAAMRRAGCGPIHTGCFGGGCGICKMKLLTGEVHHAKRMSRAHVTEEEQAQGFALICCVQPRSDILLANAR